MSLIVSIIGFFAAVFVVVFVVAWTIVGIGRYPLHSLMLVAMAVLFILSQTYGV